MSSLLDPNTRFFGFFSYSHWGCFRMPFIRMPYWQAVISITEDDDVWEIEDGTIEVDTWGTE